MPDPKRVFLPWGDFAPDLGEFGHDRLTRCENVAPAFGNFYPLPKVRFGSGSLSGTAGFGGLHVHQSWGSTHHIYAGGYEGLGTEKLYEISTDGSAVTDRTRAAGGDYTAREWGFTSYGPTIIACDFNDAVQHIQAGGANFADGITSTFKPRGRYPFVIKGNVFIAHCNLPANYDTLGAGNNPYLVVWSKTDAPAIYGSPAVDPQHVGAGFQQLFNDLGYITAVQGGEYGLVFQERGIVRIDGPPYTFRVISDNLTTRYPYSVVKVDEDVYFWSRSGPAVLRGGEGPAQAIGDGKVSRSVLDNYSGFTSTTFYEAQAPPVTEQGVYSAYIPRLGSVAFFGQKFSTVASHVTESLALIYNVREGRFSFYRPTGSSQAVAFVRQRPEQFGSGVEWLPSSALVAVGSSSTASGFNAQKFATFEFNQSVASLSHVFRRAYAQLDEQKVTRVLRVRPVHRLSPDASTLTLTVTLDSTNSPSASPTTVTSTTQDVHGWYTLPDSIEADFHRVQVAYSFADDANPNLMEAQGVEVEWVEGGSYGA